MKRNFLAVVLVTMIGVVPLASDVEFTGLQLMPDQACTVLFRPMASRRLAEATRIT